MWWWPFFSLLLSDNPHGCAYILLSYEQWFSKPFLHPRVSSLWKWVYRKCRYRISRDRCLSLLHELKNWRSNFIWIGEKIFICDFQGRKWGSLCFKHLLRDIDVLEYYDGFWSWKEFVKVLTEYGSATWANMPYGKCTGVWGSVNSGWPMSWRRCDMYGLNLNGRRLHQQYCGCH